ncbi:MAG: prealbumin-like fold domain-containing protein [Eubacteriales bacterium]|nr:prealbumin-like fold domain-containing protein [Eubacteriales bacterium]
MEDITVNVTYDQEEYTVTAENTLKRGKVEVNKKDSMFGKNLANVKFGIYTAEGELVQEVVTDSKGVVVSDVLTYGNYYLKELQPAFGYKQNETEYEFSIDADGKYEIIVAHGPKGIVDTGSVTGAVLPLGLAVMFLCLILIGISIRKQTAVRHR